MATIDSTPGVITVYHQQRVEDKHMWDPMFTNDGPAPWPHQYKAVAKVATDELGEAWRLTNHIDSAWTANKTAGAIGTQHRSSMTGDVFEKGGKFFMVMAAGFEEMK